MLYNAAMFGVMLKPPLSNEDLSGRVITFEPVTFGDANLIGRTRLRSLLADKNIAGIYVWDSAEQNLLPMSNWRDNGLSPPVHTFELTGAKCTLEDKNQFLQSPAIDVPSTDFDFLDLTLKIESTTPGKPLAKNAILVISWSGATHPIFEAERQIAMPLKEGENTYRFSIGELKTWASSRAAAILNLALMGVSPAVGWQGPRRIVPSPRMRRRPNACARRASASVTSLIALAVVGARGRAPRAVRAGRSPASRRAAPPVP